MLRETGTHLLLFVPRMRSVGCVAAFRVTRFLASLKNTLDSINAERASYGAVFWPLRCWVAGDTGFHPSNHRELVVVVAAVVVVVR